MKKWFLLAPLMGLFSPAGRSQNLPQLNKDNIKQIVAALTTEEKVNLVVGMGMDLSAFGQGPTIGVSHDKVPGAAGSTYAVPRLGIPGTVVSDGPAGVRIEPKRKDDPNTYYATAFPVETLIASSWDTKLAEEIGRAFGSEVKEYGVDVILGPAMNIHRNPLGGRNFEYYSEDPLLTGKMAAAEVRGLQSNGIGVSIKHFAVNNQETRRSTVNAVLSERALREIYLKGFGIAVREANPWTVMSSYNYLNGTYTSESYDLLTTVLRKEWGFKGMVMTDWFGGKNAVAQMKAGNDLLMPGTNDQKKRIAEALANGQLPMAALNENVSRVLNYIVQTPSFKKYAYTNKPDLKLHAALVRRAAAEGMILLKNNAGSLPLAAATSIATFGNASYRLISGGTGSGEVNKAYMVSLGEGLANAGFKVDADVKDLYTSRLNAYDKEHPRGNILQEFMHPTPPAPEVEPDQSMLYKKAAETDAAIYTIGRIAGEGRDRNTEGDFYLSDLEKALIKKISMAYRAKGKKLIVVINSGGVVDMASWRDDADAILLSWQGGEEAGNSIADVLSGKTNPSGKLASTFPVKYEDDASAKNFPGKEFPEKAVTGAFGQKEVPGEAVYEEGIYVGYRYYNTFGVKPAYEFGYGLSYTDFAYGKISLSSNTLSKPIVATVTITNTGKVAGKEVVELYVAPPKGKLDKPAMELRGFAKTDLLQPGQSQKISFTLSAADLASFDPAKTAWVTDAGQYTVKIGASSENIKQTAVFNVAQAVTAEKCNKVLAPQVPINELKK